MATKKPRINMAVRPEFYDVVSRLAKLQHTSRSSVVADLLEQAIPVLERVVVIGEAAQRAQSEAKESLRSSLEKAEAAVLPHVTAAMDQLDMLLPAPGSQTGVGFARSPTAAEPRPASLSVAKRPGRGTVLGRRRGKGGPRPVTRGPGKAGKRTGKPGRKRSKV